MDPLLPYSAKMRCLLLISLLLMANFATLRAQKTGDNSCQTDGEINLVSHAQQRQNTTCIFAVFKVEVCEMEGTDLKWKTICDTDWTQEDATVACREGGYSTTGANVTQINLSVTDEDRISFAVPNCRGSEVNMSECGMTPTLSEVSSSCDNENIAAVKCFPVDPNCPGREEVSTSSIETTTPSPPTNSDPSTESSPIQVSTTPTNTDPQAQNFIQTPLGLGVMCAVIVIILIVTLVTFLIVILVVCKRSRVNKLETSRVSPQNGNPDDSLKDDSVTKDHYEQPALNNSPDRSRHTTSTSGLLTPEHHNIYLDHQGPIYEHVKDVPSSSVSSQGSNRSATEPSNSLPTYSTLEQSYSDYAQVQPFISGSLTRGASLQDDTEVYSHYRSLNRTTSQGSNKEPTRTPNANSLPRGQGLMPVGSVQHPSPNQSPKRPRTSSANNASELPVYAILEVPPEYSGGDVDSEVSNSAVVSHRVSPSHVNRVQHYAVLEPANQQQLQTNNMMFAGRSRTNTHENVMPRFKSSTLPNTGRSGPSYPNGVAAHPRWSGCLDTRELPNGLETSRLSTHSTHSNPADQDRYAVNTWV